MRRRDLLLLGVLLSCLVIGGTSEKPNYDDVDDDLDEHSFDTDNPEDFEAIKQEREFFEEYDLDKDSFLSWPEYDAAMKAVNSQMPGEEASGGASTEMAEVQELNAKQDFADEDVDRDGKLSLEEWIAATFHGDAQAPQYDDSGLEELTPEELEEHRKFAREEFHDFDKDKDGKLTFQEVLDLVKREEELELKGHPSAPLPEGDMQTSVRELFQEMDIDKSGEVSLQEFLEAQYDIKES